MNVSQSAAERTTAMSNKNIVVSTRQAVRNLYLSNHAAERANQRGISPDDIAYTCSHGTRVYRTGVCFYFLRSRDLPECDRGSRQWERLIGLTVLVHDDGLISTLYRSYKGPRIIAKKTKYAHQRAA